MKTRPAGIGNVNADWMGSLPSKLSAMPLKHLAVPGSHDSFTFWVDVHAPVGPDQKVYVKYLATIFRVLAKKVMVKWSMTQNRTFKEQLDAGIRYFDLRVSSKSDEPGNEIYFIHGLFGHKVRDGLLEISSFLGRHRKEVVFLDFNHYYAMDTEHHVYLINMLQEVFGRKLCNNCAVESVTLDYLWEKKYQGNPCDVQEAANKEAGGSYEPQLTNVFTMQWFLTMFATCLPARTVLKIWDSVFFEGSEVLFRVALAIWERLGERIEYCQTADEFYSTMGCLTQEMLEHSLIDSTELMQEVYCMAVFPFPQLAELREKYTYNITPFPTSVKSNGSGGLGSWESDDDAEIDDEDSVVTALGCLGPLGGLLAPELQRYQKHLKDQRAEQGNIAELSPGAVGGARAEHQAAINSMMMERMSTDICALKKQYARIKRRQQQQAMQLYIRTDKCPATRVMPSQLNPSSSMINHLLLGRKSCGGPRDSRTTSSSMSTLSGAQLASLSQSQGSLARQRCGSLPSNGTGSSGSSGGGAGSPWRTRVRIHRRNLAMDQTQLCFGDLEDREDEEEVDEEGSVRMESEEERKFDENEREEQTHKERSDTAVSPPRGHFVTASVCEEAPQAAGETEEAVDVAEVVVQLDSLDLEDESSPATQPTFPECEPAPIVPLLSPPPSSNRHQDQESSSSGPKSNTGSGGLLPSIALPPPHPSSTSCIPSSSPSSSSASPVPTSVSLGPSCSSSPTPPSTPTPNTASHLTSSSSANGLSALSPPASCTLNKTSFPSMPSLHSSSSKWHLSSSPSTPAVSCATCTPKQQIFSPFPCVKQPRKSVAARNLGLYSPTSRTPTVHFPQLSRNLNRSSAAGTTRRR